MGKGSSKQRGPRSRRPSGSGPCGAGEGRARAHAGRAPDVEEPGRLEASFEPAFADFSVPAETRAAYGAWEAAAVGEARASAGEDAGDGSPAGPCAPGAEFALGRVIRLDRGYPLVATGEGSFRAEHAIGLVKEADVRAAVGDWVALRLPRGHDKALIERVLPRWGALTRWDGSNRGERQVLAANLDVLIVVQPLSKRAVPIDRIVRSLVLACEGGARCAVALTKADRAPDERRLSADVAAVRAAVGTGVPIAVVSCAEGRGIEDVRGLVPTGGCALLLGESGAGKSTLANALLGAELLGVGAVRGRDDQGRHTTVARRMLKVPGAGVLVDAPGLRSLPLLDEARGLARAFPEIDALVLQCRFRDCTHGSEPGCAVRDGVRSGAVDEGRLDEYRMLAAEMLANRRGLAPSARASITQ